MSSPHRPRVALVGLGPIGIEVGKALAGRDSMTLLGAADPAPDKAGRPLSDLLSGAFPATTIRPSAAALYAESAGSRGRADVVLLCTGSRLHAVLPQIEEALRAGFHVISTCEELAYPELGHLPMARQIDRLAKDHGVSVLGTGVNPGLVMDRLVLAVASACVRVESVKVTRVVDAAKRRGPLRAKVGADLTVEEFQAGVAARRLGHRGLPESCALIGLGLGMPLDDIRSTIEPVVADAAHPRAGIEPGRVAGLRQSAVGFHAGREVARLDLEMSVAAPDPHDRIVIEGDPPLDVLVRGGTHGDRGTVGTVLSAIPAVIAAAPGLKTVLDITL